MSPEYLAAYKADSDDMLQAGVLGMKWGIRKTRYTAPTQTDRDLAVRAYRAKTGKNPDKGSTLAIVNPKTNNLHIFKVNKVKRTGPLGKKRIFDMTHEGSYAVDKKGKVTTTLHAPRKRLQTRTVSLTHSDDVPDYIGMAKVEDDDAEQSGVKGMKWGVRRDRSQLRAAAKARGDAPKKTTSTDKPKTSSTAVKPKGDIQDKVETSASRYARLESQAKAGKASDMSEADLKFFNARTDALAKIEKITAEEPSWLRQTTTKVVQQTAQNQMQNLADGLANKYIGDPIKDALKGKTTETVEDAIQRGASERIRKTAIEKGIDELVKKRTA